MKKLLLAIIYLFVFHHSAVALVEVDITRGNLDPLPIAVSPLYIEPGSRDIKQGDKTSALSFKTKNLDSGKVPTRRTPKVQLIVA